jgi:hypothetical protein
VIAVISATGRWPLCDGYANAALIPCTPMNPETRIDFKESDRAFRCEEYFLNNFIGYLKAKSISVDSPERIESITQRKVFSLRLTKESPPLTQEEGDGLVAQFLAADEEIKSRR